MLSGCLVAAVPPDVEYAALSELILPLKRSDEALPASQIESVMGGLSDAELKKKLLRAFIYARQAFVGQTRLAEIFGIIDRWEQGARGYLVSVRGRLESCSLLYADRCSVPSQLSLDLRHTGRATRVVHVTGDYMISVMGSTRVID